MIPEHLYTTRCNVPGCDKKFEAPSLSIPIVGRPPLERAVKYVSKLAEHIQKSHPNLAAPAMQAMMNMFGWIAVQHFTIEDPALMKILDETRRSLHLVTRGRWIDDATILDRTARLGLDTEKQNEVMRMLAEMRDFLCEVQPAQPSPIVHPVVPPELERFKMGC